MRASRRHRALRALGIAALVLVVLLAAARVALEPFLASRLRRVLNESPDTRGSLSRVALSVIHLSCEVEDLHIEQLEPGLGWTRFVNAQRVQVGLYWSELLRGHLKLAAGKGGEQGTNPKPSPGRLPPRGGRSAVASTPEGLMNPGSVGRIPEALKSQGYLQQLTGALDEPTSTALRRFQRDRDLAETGAPDRETLRRLGVDPEEVYRTGQANQ